MKKIIALLILPLIFCFASVSADDIWEPEPEEFTIFTLFDSFDWGDSYKEVMRELELHEVEGIRIETDEDEVAKTITYRGENDLEQYSYNFMFTKDTERLWMIYTSTVLLERYRPDYILEEIREFYGINDMESFDNEDLTLMGDELLDEYMINAEENTIFFTGYDCTRYSVLGDRIFFTAIDREYFRILPEYFENLEPDEAEVE